MSRHELERRRQEAHAELGADRFELLDSPQDLRREMSRKVLAHARDTGGENTALEWRRDHDAHAKPLCRRKDPFERDLAQERVGVRHHRHLELARFHVGRVVNWIVRGHPDMAHQAVGLQLSHRLQRAAGAHHLRERLGRRIVKVQQLDPLGVETLQAALDRPHRSVVRKIGMVRQMAALGFHHDASGQVRPLAERTRHEQFAARVQVQRGGVDQSDAVFEGRV
jgi:hypothetical protein